MATSLITLLSTVHGRDRRKLRSIEKCDLQAAVKYGKKESGHPDPRTRLPRWKYTFGNVVYITDSSSRTEVTSYVLPLEIDEVPLSASDEALHVRLSSQLQRRPELSKSHTVLGECQQHG